MGAPTCLASCLRRAPGLCDPAGPGLLPAWLASRPGVQSTQHPEQWRAEGLTCAPTRSLRNPPPVSWGFVTPEQGQGTLGVTRPGSHAPPHAVAEPVCHGQHPLHWDFLGSRNLALADAAASVPFSCGAAARTPSFSAPWPPKCLQAPPKLLACPEQRDSRLAGPPRRFLQRGLQLLRPRRAI